MQESYVVNLDTLVLLALIVLHTLALEAVKFGWTMSTVWEVKLPLSIARIVDGAHMTVVTVKMHLSFAQVSSDRKQVSV